MSEPKTLLLSETGVEALPDGSTAVNVGPIVRALKFLTEERGDDRGTDEAGRPLPDLMSLAFEVVEAIILGGRKADHFRQVKRELDAQTTGGSRSSLTLAKQARRVHAPTPPTSLEHAADSLQALLGELAGLSLAERAAQELKQALESFRAFGADRWVSATAQLLVAVNALGAARPAALPAARARAKRKSPARPAAKQEPRAKRRAPRKARQNKPPRKKSSPAKKSRKKPANKSQKKPGKRRRKSA